MYPFGAQSAFHSIDALLKHDIGKFVTPAMILAVENFKSDNWSIRNSALMCFTSLTKRMLNTTNV